MFDKESLKKFETEIANTYETGVIKAPVHLRDGNENKLFEFFENIK